MDEPLRKILVGRKTLKLRAKHNRQLGPVALIRKGSGLIHGVAEIVDSIGPMSFDEFCSRAHEHAVEPDRLREVFEKGWRIGWQLQNVIQLSSPVSYIHKGMSQVKLKYGSSRRPAPPIGAGLGLQKKNEVPGKQATPKGVNP